jgi:hypothetical protein
MRQSNLNLFSNTAMVGNCHDEGYLVKVSILCPLAETSGNLRHITSHIIASFQKIQASHIST